jgi:tRNA(Ile2)-agmatinylcytidine synthase
MVARSMIESEEPGIEQIWITNQGTDAHLLRGKTGHLDEMLSYYVPGTVTSVPKTRTGGHVSFIMNDEGFTVRCMAYEPTKNFRQIVRQLMPGDEIIAVGSYKKGSINLEKMKIISLARADRIRPPACRACNKRMTSDGKGKGWKCKKCGARSDMPDLQEISRTLVTGWYEVPPTARRHLARPLCRGIPHF